MSHLSQIIYPTINLQPSENDALGTGWWRGQFIEWGKENNPFLADLVHNKTSSYRAIQFRNCNGKAAIAFIGNTAREHAPKILGQFRPEKAYRFTQEYYPDIVENTSGIYTYTIPYFLLSNNYAEPFNKKYAYEVFRTSQDIWNAKSLFEEKISKNIAFLLHQLNISIDPPAIQLLQATTPKTAKVGKKGTKDILRTTTSLTFTTAIELPLLGSIGAELALGFGRYKKA